MTISFWALLLTVVVLVGRLVAISKQSRRRVLNLINECETLRGKFLASEQIVGRFQVLHELDLKMIDRLIGLGRRYRGEAINLTNECNTLRGKFLASEQTVGRFQVLHELDLKMIDRLLKQNDDLVKRNDGLVKDHQLQNDINDIRSAGVQQVINLLHDAGSNKLVNSQSFVRVRLRDAIALLEAIMGKIDPA